MNRQEFKQVSRNFIAWAGKFRCEPNGHLAPVGPAGALTRVHVNLAIASTGFVPGGLNARVPFHQLTQVYRWKPRGIGFGDGSFEQTCGVLARLSNNLITAATEGAAFNACRQILEWGGDRNAARGATPFLAAHRDAGTLRAYLASVKNDLKLETAVVQPAGALGSVQLMNSMLTKVHAFNSGDGLPIYDSRVAGAIATIVETWRQEAGLHKQPLPGALWFPKVGGSPGSRSTADRYPGCLHPGTLHYAPEGSARMRAHSRSWAGAKVRLGWLLSELLEEPTADGIRSLEACLFMAGSDCTWINREAGWQAGVP